MNLLVWAAAVVALLGALILVHELGHFVCARLFDVKVLRFSLGFGPRLFGFTWGETEYRLSLVPLGGFVRLLGEDPAEAISPRDRPRALATKPLWQRYTIVIAGPVFNLVLPLLIYLVHYAGQRTLLPPTLGTVLPDYPAAAAGLVPGDTVEAIDGKRIRYWEELEDEIANGPDAAPPLRDTPRHRSRGAGRDAGSYRAARRARHPRDGRVDRGLAALPPARDRRHRSRLAGGAGGSEDLRLRDGREWEPGRDLDRVPARHRSGGRLSAADHLPARRLLGGAVRPCRDPAARDRGRDPQPDLRPHRAPELRDRRPVGRAVRVLRRAGEPGRRHRDPARRSHRRARRQGHRQLGSPAPEAGRQPRADLPDRVDLAGRRLASGALPPGGALRDGRLPAGGAAPGVRRAQPAGLANRRPRADPEPLRLRGVARLRAHRPHPRRRWCRASSRSRAGACRCRRWAGRS